MLLLNPLPQRLDNGATPTFAGLTAPTATDLTLAGGSTGASLVLGQGAGGAKIVGQSPSSPMTVNIGQTGTAGTSIEMVTSAGIGYIQHFNRTSVAYVPLEIAGDYVQTRTAAGVSTRLTSTGNLLIGTTTDSGNGKLQLATHTTSAGGIGFGTDLSLYRGNTGLLILNDTSGALDARIGLHNNGTQRGLFEAYNVGTAVYMGAASAGWGTIITSGNQVAALTLASNQAATFAGDIAGKKIVLDVLGEQLTMTRTGVGTAVLAVGGSAELYGKAASYAFYNAAGSSAYLTIASSAAATFAGAVAINNTVATAVAVASTHKVTMVIGGVTYYLLASNV